ncbi:hypothetical protein JTE90_024550 [Oedothorax gibbosus]|uniref:Uncharacterized protein n=1 Tax=Oedothorax gibbosus TaxID=931172 RepID=A0AAV6VE10_9ARAC|nr:hypothetical protein JTE90_024550 [Oedothorax gibbosus]
MGLPLFICPRRRGTKCMTSMPMRSEFNEFVSSFYNVDPRPLFYSLPYEKGGNILKKQPISLKLIQTPDYDHRLLSPNVQTCPSPYVSAFCALIPILVGNGVDHLLDQRGAKVRSAIVCHRVIDHPDVLSQIDLRPHRTRTLLVRLAPSSRLFLEMKSLVEEGAK